MLLLRGKQSFRISSQIVISMRNITLSTGSRDPDSSNGHIFKKVWTKPELIEHLSSNVYYEDDNNVVVNKPYGILSRINKTKPVVFKDEGIRCESAIENVLPDLCERFRTENLDLVLHPQWLYSGLTILSKGKSNKSDILKDFSSIKKENRVFSYLAVVLGSDIPPTYEDSFRISSNFEIIEHKKKKKKEKHGILLSYKHRVLGSSKGASLIQIDLNYNYLQCLRLILTTKCFSPVLGEMVYSSRVTTLFEVPLLVSPREEPSTKKLFPSEIVKILQLNPEDVDCCPCHVHLYSAMFSVKSQKFVAAVPPPEYFVWTCEQFGLKEVKQFFRGLDDCRERKEAVADGH